MIRHAAVNVELNAGLFGSVGQRLADGHFIPPCQCVNKGQFDAGKERIDKGLILERTGHDGNIVQVGQLSGNMMTRISDMSLDAPSYSRGDTNDGGCLSACSIDSGDSSGRCHMGLMYTAITGSNVNGKQEKTEA